MHRVEIEMAMKILFLLISLLHSTTGLSSETSICSHIQLKDGKLKLNANEKTLVCGSNEGSESWKDVSIPQAQLHLNSILQNLGYLNPRFERKGDFLEVWQNQQTLVKALSAEDKTKILDVSKKRKIVGEPMMPQKINEVETWASQMARSHGYACPQIKTEAHVWDQSIVILAELGGKKTIASLKTSDLGDLNADVLQRSQPFEIGDTYDVRETQIMTARLLNEGLFQSAVFLTACRPDEVDLKLETSVGKFKILRFGVGGSTEELPFVDATFKNARLDDQASSFTVLAHASPRRLKSSLTSELYYFRGWHRTFLGPRIEFDRTKENLRQTETLKAGVDIGRNWDQWDIRFLGRVGPTMNYTKTLEGIGPKNLTYPTLDSSLSLMNHIYESQIQDQFEGWTSSLSFRTQGKGLGGKADIQHYEVNFKQLWNMGGFSPPAFVLGTRIQAVAVDAGDVNSAEANEFLPQEDRIFAGGDDNLRGFPRQSLNNQNLGYLSFLYIGFEGRLIEELPYHFQPLLLVDFGRLGQRKFTLDKSLFLSQGLGLRWPSPFGTLRFSLSKGKILNRDSSTELYPDQWIFFASFGQEF